MTQSSGRQVPVPVIFPFFPFVLLINQSCELIRRLNKGITLLLQTARSTGSPCCRATPKGFRIFPFTMIMQYFSRFEAAMDLSLLSRDLGEDPLCSASLRSLPSWPDKGDRPTELLGRYDAMCWTPYSTP
jgi:hypothetical protein